MAIPSILNRRHFLVGAGAMVAVTATGGAAIAQSPDPYSAATWEPLVGTALSVGPVHGTLAQFERFTSGSFGLTFEIETGKLEEGLHTVQHPAVRTVDLFMTAHQQRALAIINRTQGANK